MAKKASEHVRYYQNPNGPVIGTVSRNIIEKDGFYFKDLDGSGEFQKFDDWRLPAKERAEAYVNSMTRMNLEGSKNYDQKEKREII